MPPITGMQKLINTVAGDGKITGQDVKDLIAKAEKNGIVSRAEKTALKDALEEHAAEFDPEARTKLESFLARNTAPSGTASALMEAKLAAAKHGGIGASELARAHADVSARFGENEASEVLLASLGVNAESLTMDAVGWVQGKYGAMDGHVARYQTVLGTHLKDAKILAEDKEPG